MEKNEYPDDFDPTRDEGFLKNLEKVLASSAYENEAIDIDTGDQNTSILTIGEDVEEEQARQAEQTLEEAEALKAACQAKLDGAEAEIHEARSKAQQAAQQAADAQLAQAQEQARQIVAKARTEAEQRRERVLRESQRELRQLAAAAARKLAAQPGTDPFDQFLNLAEEGGAHEDR